MRIRRTQRFPGRTIAVDGIDPEVGQVMEVPDELASMLIARGDFQPGDAPWPIESEPMKAKVSPPGPKQPKGKKAKAEPIKAESEEG